MRFKAVICIIGGLLLYASDLIAQENPSWRDGITVDFSAGMPFYMGDFDHLWKDESEYLQLPMGPMAQYNTTAFSGSINFPLSQAVDFRIRLSHANLFYTETGVNVNFRNSLLDASGLLQLHLINQRFGWYINTGLGVNSHYDAEVFRTLDEMETEPNTDRVRRMTTSFGTGFQYSITPTITVFTEADWMFIGSDRFDGYNGPDDEHPELEADDEKSYFSRDKLLNARGGIRITLFNRASNTDERPYSDLVSSYVPDPEAPEPEEEEEEITDDRPDEYRRIGVLLELEGITVAVEYADNLEDLERQKMVAQRFAQQISTPQKQIEVFLLKDNQGYTVHFGTFSSTNEARQFIGPIGMYYSGAQLRRH